MVELTKAVHQLIPALVTVVAWLPELDSRLKILNLSSSTLLEFMVLAA
jgi:hypothetical protein